MDRVAIGADQAIGARPQIEAAIVIEGGTGGFEFRAKAMAAGKDEIDGFGIHQRRAGDALKRHALGACPFPQAHGARFRDDPRWNADDHPLADQHLRKLDGRVIGNIRGTGQAGRHEHRQDHDTLPIMSIPESL